MDPREVSHRLRVLGEHPPTEEARMELSQALWSKTDGFRVVAAQRFCKWGDRASIDAVKAVIWILAAKPVRWSTVGAMCRAISPYLKTSEDVDWAFRLFSEQSHHDDRYFVGAYLFEGQSPSVVLGKLGNLKSQASGCHNWHRDLEGAIARAEYRLRAQA